MIVRTIDEVGGSPDRDRSGEGWRSLRFLTAGDACGFSLHLTTVDAGAELDLWYKHHIEANLCIAGEGTVTDRATGSVHRLAPGIMYTLDQHDRHVVRADTELTLVCVFDPALVGTETHDADGSYDLPRPGSGE